MAADGTRTTGGDHQPSPSADHYSRGVPAALTTGLPPGKVALGRDHRASRRLGAVVLIGVVALVLAAAASLFVGSGDITAAQAWNALLRGGTGPTELIVREVRVPRTLLAITVGAALGVAGALMQAITRNPLADPGILGVNAGAYAAVVVAAALLGSTIGTTHVLIALAGAAAASAVVYLVGTSGPGGGTPAKLVLTGVALSAILSGVGYAVTLLRPEVFDRVRFWSAGSLQGRGYEDLWTVLPFIAAGLMVAMLLPRALDALALGDDVAAGLGARPGLVRVVAAVAITLLCGAATAAAGPISFVGLIVPHTLRLLVGPDWRRLLPLCLLASPLLLLVADVLGRVVAPVELAAGVVTAAVGAPLLIALVNRARAGAL